MANKITIPVEIKLNQNSLNSLSSHLTTIANNTSSKFSAQQQTQATKLLQTIGTLSQKVSGVLSSDEITKDQMDSFKSIFNYVSKESKKLGQDINTSLEVKGEKILSTEDIARLDQADAKIQEAKKKLEELGQVSIKPKKFEEILPDGVTKEELKMSTTTNLTTALARLEKYNAAYDTLMAKDNKILSAKEATELQWLENTKASRDKAHQAVTEQIAKEKDSTESLKNAKKAVNDTEKEREKLAIKAIEAATKSERTVTEALINESKQLEKNNEQLKLKETLTKLSGDLDPFSGLMKGAASNFNNFVTGIASGTILINVLRKTLRETIQTIKDLDKAFNDIAVVTTYTTAEVWDMKDAFVDIADTTGLALTEVTKIAGEFFRQGRSLSEVLKLTEAAGIAAKVAGISATDSVNYLTSAINAYKLSADQAMVVSDKFAALAAASATDYEELAIALSKVAAQAYSAGVNIDNMMGFIAKALEVTREAPENIGTAFKTIFARMSELKDFGKTLEDGMDINRIDKALASVGIALTTEEGTLRNLDEVLIDIGNQWTTLTKNQKAYVTAALAGTRQQTRLLAVFEDFDRTMELVDISANSLGATFAQQEKYYLSIAYAQNQLTVAWQDFLSSLGSSTVFILFYNTLGGIVDILNNAVLAIETYHEALFKGALIVGSLVVIYKLFIATLGQTVAMAFTSTGAVSLLAGAYAALSGFIGTATTALKAFMLHNPLGWIVIAVGLLAYFGSKLEETEKKNKKFVEQMRKSQAEIFNFRKEADDLDILLKKYREIEDSVTKTKEDLAQQTEYIKQMQDLLGEEGKDLTGRFNAQIVEDAIQKRREEAETAFDEAIEHAKKEYLSLELAYMATTDTLVRQQLLLQNAVEEKLITSYSAFLEKSVEERTRILAESQLELSKLTYLTKYDEEGNKIGGIADEEKLAEAKRILAELFDQDFANSPLTKQLDQLKEMNFENWDWQITDAIGALSPELQNIIALMGQFGTESVQELNDITASSDLTTQQIIKLNTVLSDINLSSEQHKELLRSLTAEGGNTFETLRNFANKYNLDLFQTLDLAQQLRDAMNETSMIDLGNQLKSLQGVADNIAKVNAMISGEQEYDLAFMNEMVNIYPEIGSAIAANAQVSEATTQAIMAADKEAFKTKIDLQIAELEATYTSNELKIQALEEMLVDEEELNVAMADSSVDLQTATNEEIYKAWLKHLKKKAEANLTFEQTAALQSIRASSYMTPAQKDAAEAEIKNLNLQTEALDGLINAADQGTTSYTSFKDRIQANIDTLTNNNKTIRAQIANLNFLKINIDKVTKATKDGTKAAAEYKAKLTELYILEQQLAVLEAKLGEYVFNEENAKTGEAWLISIYSQNKALEAQDRILTDIVRVSKNQQNTLFSALTSEAQNAVKIINGRMVPVMEKYIRLNGEQQEAVDTATEEYNGLSESITENTQKQKENTKAIEESLQKIEDKTVEFYDTLKDAVTNAEKKKLDALIAGLEEERKLLEKRRSMYEKAFAETDYSNTLEELEQNRQEIIKDIAALEGATDLASAKKREELLTKKAELDKEYNSNVTDYNREALYQTIEDAETAIDLEQEQYEAAYEERINSVRWMEEEIQTIQNEGLDATIAYLKEHLPEYEEAWTVSKDNIERAWVLLYDTVNTTVDEIQNNLPDFSDMLSQLREASNLVSQISGTSGTGPLSSPTGGKALKYRITSASYSADGFTSEAAAKAALEAKKAEWGREIKRNQQLMLDYPSASRNAQSQIDLFNQRINGLNGYKITSHSLGGLATSTGLAMLHGTRSKPERILSPIQTELFERMIQSLETTQNAARNQFAPAVTSNGLSISNVSIAVGGLETDQQFADAGAAFAKELKAAIKERGLNVNKKR